MAEEGQKSSVLKWILIGCGSIVLIAVVVMAGCFYYVKKKVVDPAKQAMDKATVGAPAVVRGPVMALSMMKPFMGMMVAPADKPAVDKMFADLDAKASMLDAQDGKDLKAAMDSYNESNRSAGADQLARQAGARKLIADAQAVLDRH